MNLFALAAVVVLHCWKPVVFSATARRWVDVLPVEGRTDVMELQYGVGLASGMTDIQFRELVPPPIDGEVRSDAASAIQISFTRDSSGRFDLEVRDRARGKSARVKHFRCE